MLSRLAALGVEALEIGAGGYPGKAHCAPAALLAKVVGFPKPLLLSSPKPGTLAWV